MSLCIDTLFARHCLPSCFAAVSTGGSFGTQEVVCLVWFVIASLAVVLKFPRSASRRNVAGILYRTAPWENPDY